MEYILIFISAIFVNNIVLSQFLGICPFLGVSKKIDTSLVTWLVQKYVLDAFGLQYLQTIAFILVIASLVQLVEIVLKKVSPALYQALGIFLPLITTNCAVLGVAILVIQSYRFRTGSHRLCRNARAAGTGEDSQGYAGHGYRDALRRTPFPGLHGLLGSRWWLEAALRPRLRNNSFLGLMVTVTAVTMSLLYCFGS